jgi:hypothetical protein
MSFCYAYNNVHNMKLYDKCNVVVCRSRVTQLMCGARRSALLIPELGEPVDPAVRQLP